MHAGDRRKEARHARRRITCVFPTQCIARYTEELYEVQGNTKHARAFSALSCTDSDEDSSRSYCAQLTI